MEEIVKEAKQQLDKTVEAYEGRLSKLRSGRANPQMLSGIKCDYYGDKMEITALASISMPEPRQLLIKPYSREDIKTIAAAIAAANLGVNPQVEATDIRIIVPPLTEDTRKQIAKEAKGIADEAKVAVRNVRRDFMDLLKDDDTMTDDLKDRIEEDLKKIVTETNKRIDDILAVKQKEIMTI